MELETDWLARSQDNGLGWDITAYPWRGASVGWHYKDWPRVGLAQDGSSTYTPHTNTTLFRDQPIELGKNLVPVAIRLQNCQLQLKALITHSLTLNRYRSNGGPGWEGLCWKKYLFFIIRLPPEARMGGGGGISCLRSITCWNHWTGG